MKGYLGILLNLSKAEFFATGTDATKLFFTCLDADATTDSSLWYSRLKSSVWKISFDRAMIAGEKMDSSASPLYTEHFAEMVNAHHAFLGVVCDDVHAHAHAFKTFSLSISLFLPRFALLG